jgi:hypothetical protein
MRPLGMTATSLKGYQETVQPYCIENEHRTIGQGIAANRIIPVNTAML